MAGKTKTQAKKKAKTRGKKQAAVAAKARKPAKTGRKSKKYRYTAATADKYELYQRSVQSPVEDIQFLVDVYRRERGRNPRHFREDFCGTALLTSHWIQQGPRFTAEGFDIDPQPVDWGKRHNFAPLGAVARRATLHLKDAREPSDKSPDVRCAQNFSYWVFKTRAELLDYFRKAHADLAPEGVFVIDLHGGPESIEEMEEETEMNEGFSYVWDQDKIWPITGEAVLRIHFRFPDGSEMRDAFVYDWRLWGLPELRDVLQDAGFARIDCYWEGTDEDGESGNGVFTKEQRGEACLSYVAYLVALK